jgi:mannose-1-phosphate guanylyltransferase
MNYTDLTQDFLGVEETNLPRPERARWSTDNGKTWAIVLAGGAGTRLRLLTANREGVLVPKQYCSLDSGPSLLQEALQRAFTIVPRRRTSVVVAEQHAPWWGRLARELPPGSIAVQPEDRGTATGILLALVRILERDPNARVVVLPSDHHVVDEPVLTRSLANAIGALLYRRAEIVLLGVAPDDADPDLGYIAPDGPATCGLLGVAEFVEKPSRARAARLIKAGALWNTFIVVANGRELLELLRAREASVVADLRRCALDGHRDIVVTSTLREIYRGLPVLDFSRDVAQQNPAAFSAVRVPACGWTDLGTVDRVRRLLRAQAGGRGAAALAADHDAAPVSLARAVWTERLPAHASCDLTDELGVSAIEMMPTG